MITGKHSALKGFGLLAWMIVAILTLIGCANYNPFFAIVGLVNLALNSIMIVKLFTYFSGEK